MKTWGKKGLLGLMTLMCGIALSVGSASASDEVIQAVQPDFNLVAGHHEVVRVAARPPLGFQLLCLRHAEYCRGGGVSRIDATDEVLELLRRVNGSVNRAIRPRNDAGADVWTFNPASGDCEDYVITKRQRLIEAGVSPGALRIAVVTTRQGEPHAVLIVKTLQGDFVLDNLTNSIRPVSQMPHRLVSMSGANPVSRWS